MPDYVLMVCIPALANSPGPLAQWPLGLQLPPWPWLGRRGVCVCALASCVIVGWHLQRKATLGWRFWLISTRCNRANMLSYVMPPWRQRPHPPPANRLSAYKTASMCAWSDLVLCWEHKTYDSGSLQYQQHHSGTFVCWRMLYPASRHLKPCRTHLEGSWKAKATLQTNLFDKCWHYQEPVNVFAR